MSPRGFEFRESRVGFTPDNSVSPLNQLK